MASIRPNRGGNVAQRKRKRSGGSRAGSARRPTKRRSGRRRGASSFAIVRGGGGNVFAVRNIIGVQMRGAISASTQLAAEVAAGTITGKVLPATTLPGTLTYTLTQLAVGAALGIGAQKFLGRQVGQDVVTGVWAGALRRTAKGFGNQTINNVLGAADGARYVRGADGRWQQIGSYVGAGDQRGLGSYVGAGDQRGLGDEMERELYGEDLPG